MIVATAGHVDHGKTSLVKLLTGVDTDRLEEERRRGLTINLGFAYRTTPAGRSIGFIDVPGHRRLLNNMIAGIGGIDLGMLVVDAVEGVMPQTLEHLRVMRLLGVDDYVAVVTKIDRADESAVSAVLEAVGELLPDAPAFAVSGVTGQGRTELLEALDGLAATRAERPARGRFRLSVDRAFVLNGVGLVVTGTATSGRVAVGDRLRLLTAQSPREGVEVRVRSLHVQGAPAQTGAAGQRCALNLVGDVHWEDVARGDWLCEPGCAAPGLRFDAMVEVLEDVPRPLGHLQHVKLYVGAKRLRAMAFFLDGAVDAGEAKGTVRLVQFILESEFQVCSGDRFLMQDDGEATVIGGGTVLGPNAPQRRKTRAQRIQYLLAMAQGNPSAVLAALVQEHGQHVDFADFRRSVNLTDEEGDALAASATVAPWSVRLQVGDGDWLLPRRLFDETKAELYRKVRQWHASHPSEAGIQTEVLFREVTARVTKPLFMAILGCLVREKSVTLANGLVKCREYRPSANPQLQEAWVRLRDFLLQAGFRIPLFSEIDRDLGLGSRLRIAVVGAALKAGLVRQVNARRVALPATLLAIAEAIDRLAEQRGSFTVIEAKEQLGLGRDLTIELLEYFDSVRFTRRCGNARNVMDRTLPARLFANPPAPGNN